MAIFNSLGSNYNIKYVWRSLFSEASDQNRKLVNFLQEKYNGKVILTYKGREAITLALKILNLSEESQVAINGFTCYAVYKAIEAAGCIPICLDLEEKNSDLNFTPSALEKILEENKNIKVIVIQNTFGYPCDIKRIEEICKEKNLILIEDLAHCVGTKYDNGKEAGTVGDFVTLSFSQDKVIDAVSGGALVIRNKKCSNLTIEQFNNVNNFQQLKDKLYPLLTYKIRFLYNIGLGKSLHFILKNLNLLSKPMQEGLYDFYSLPNWYCNLALNEFKKLPNQLNYRREIAKIYAKNLNKSSTFFPRSIQLRGKRNTINPQSPLRGFEKVLDKKILNQNIIKNISISSNLRFPIFVENRGELIKFLKQHKIFVSDIWYDSVASECPNAVKISNVILNLPTHINVSKKDALKIAERINVWLKSQ